MAPLEAELKISRGLFLAEKKKVKCPDGTSTSTTAKKGITFVQLVAHKVEGLGGTVIVHGDLESVEQLDAGGQAVSPPKPILGKDYLNERVLRNTGIRIKAKGAQLTVQNK